ncbi:MAG: hypothetical protein COA36_09735 [Desulfotalea sp.]|nr:MAG: hypothetical protein COA36_09735 [Desulfotalea sp.]
MLNKWRRLSSKERMQYKLVCLFLIAGLYGLVFYPSAHARYFESEKMLHRKLDRIKKRTSMVNIQNSGGNPKVIQRRIDKIDKKIAATIAEFDELDTGFAPIDSTEIQQLLLLEISKLAERTGLELISVAQKGYTRKGELSIAPIDPILNRPLLMVIANGDYFTLLDFLHGLKDLSFYVSVMNLKMYTELNSEEKASMHMHSSELPPGTLTVALELSI